MPRPFALGVSLCALLAPLVACEPPDDGDAITVDATPRLDSLAADTPREWREIECIAYTSSITYADGRVSSSTTYAATADVGPIEEARFSVLQCDQDDVGASGGGGTCPGVSCTIASPPAARCQLNDGAGVTDDGLLVVYCGLTQTDRRADGTTTTTGSVWRSVRIAH